MGEQHHHPKTADGGAARRGERRRLLWVIVLTAVTMVGELAGGLYTRSLALLGDAFHMLTHLMSTALAFTAAVIACRPAAPDKTFRWWRIEVLAGLINGLALIPIVGGVLWKAVERLREPVPIDGWGTLAVGSVGLVVNIVCAGLLHRHSKHDLNIRGAFLHLLADAASSVGVLVAAGLAVLFGWTWADPAAALAIGVVVLGWCVSLVRSSSRILLEAAPTHMDLEEIRQAMKEVDGVLEVHDLHVWTITSRMYALTAHVRLQEDLPVSRAEEIGCRLRDLLDGRWEINHATLQFEVAEGASLACEREHDKACDSPRS
ncbi:MAG TPA: cation diffusion facilitator family transporter [Planctomycetota bacterium]|nr:cation diffusion facilitator family transporter [Planctomycetota bacterium]